jgi:hypothetical protein
MVGRFHDRFAARPLRTGSWLLAGAICLAVSGCASGGNSTSSADNILLSKAQERASLASRSIDEATSMIAEGQRQQAVGRRNIDEGGEKIRVGEKLKTSAELELRRAQAQIASERRLAGYDGDGSGSGVGTTGGITMIPLERP